MPPVNALPAASTSEDRLALLMQRIERKRQEEQQKPPPAPPGANGPSSPNGGAEGTEGGSGPGGGAAPRGASPARDDYRGPNPEADDRTAKTRSITGHEATRVASEPDRRAIDERTEQRRVDTHLAEGHRVVASPKSTDDAPAPAPTDDVEQRVADALPTYSERFQEERKRFDEQHRAQLDRLATMLAEQKKREPVASNLASDRSVRASPFANTVDCRDCHPDRTPPSFDLSSSFERLRGAPMPRTGSNPFAPVKVDHPELKRELDQRFDEAAGDRDPAARGALAKRYSERLATDELPQARAYEKHFRRQEAARLGDAAAAPGVDPTERERLLTLSHELTRRPMSSGTAQFVDQLERTPTSQLSHRDSKAALQTIRAHRPVDASTYDPVTGIQPGNDELFYSRAEQAQLFDPKRYATKAAPDPLQRPLFTGEKCYDCHPSKKDDIGFSLSTFPKLDTPSLDELVRGERMKFDEAVANKIRADHPGVAPNSERHAELTEKYREEDRLRRRLELAGDDPRNRLKIAPDAMTPEQRRVYDDHVANHRLGVLEDKIRPHFARLDSEYTKNGWGPDSPFYGVDREAFLADVASKDVDRVSTYERFRALDATDSFERDNPTLFDADPSSFESFRDRVEERERQRTPTLDPTDVRRLLGGEKCYACHPNKRHERLAPLDLSSFFDKGRPTTWPEQKTTEVLAPTPAEPTSPLYFSGEKQMRAAGLEEHDIAERMKAVREDPNNPIPYLRKPMSDLDDAQHRQVSEDYTRYAVEKTKRELRTSLVEKVGRQVDELDSTFDRILADQGVIGDLADGIKNNLGSKGGWLIDSELGSNAVVRTIGEAYRAKRAVRDLANFDGSHDEFVAEYQKRIGDLRTKLDAIPKHIDRFNSSQSNWVEGISDIASVSAALGAAALAPVTGGASLLVGATVGAMTKVGTKGLDAVTGSGDYDGNVGLDLLKGGLNGLSATGTNMLAQSVAKKMLANQAAKLATGQGVSMLTRGTIWGTTMTAEGALDGYIVGTGSSLIDGKSFSESQMNGLRGMAFGAVLNPLAQGSTRGLSRLWRGKPKVAEVPDRAPQRAPDADLTAPKTPEVDAPPRLAPRAFAEIAEKVDEAATALQRTLDEWPHTQGAGAKQRVRVERMAEEVALARKLLDQNPTEATAKAAQELLDASEPMRRAALEYGALQRPQRPPGQLGEAELEAFHRAQNEYRAAEKTARHQLVDAYQTTQRPIYESLRKTAGISVEPLDPTKRGAFGKDPIAEVERLKVADGEAPNRAYAELEIDGKRHPIGPSRSGGGAEEAVPNNPYEAQARHLEAVQGQHNKSRANDSEVRLLGLVDEALAKSGGKPGTLRIFTELPPCPSCQRVMAKFRADHPNVTIEVYHQ